MNPLDILLWMLIGWLGLVMLVAVPAIGWIVWKNWSGKL